MHLQRMQLIDERVLEVAWNPMFSRLAVAGPGKDVHVWDVGATDSQFALTHERLAITVDWSSDSTRIACGTADGCVTLWNYISGTMLGRLCEHTDEVRSVAFSGNGRYLATGANDGRVLIHDAVSLTPRIALDGHTDIVRSVSWMTKTSWNVGNRYLASASHDMTVRIWDVEEGRCDWESVRHSGWINDARYSGRGGYLASACDDARVRVWDLNRSGELSVLDSFGGFPVFGLAFSPDERHLATIDAGRHVRVFDLGSSREVCNDEAPPILLQRIAWSPNGDYIACSGDGVMIWQVQ